MKHTKRKLVLIMLATMIVVFAVIAVAFHYIVQAHVKSRAQNSISLYMNETDEETLKKEAEAAMVVTSFTYETQTEDPEEEGGFWENFWNSLFDDDYWNSEDVMQAIYSEEIKTWWEQEQPPAYSLNRVKIDEKTLYVSWKYDEKKPELVRFYYVNVTSEEQLLKTVRISLYVIMAVCLAGACLAGFFMGKRIETDQNRQKEFFENASHELKTPLMSIQGYAEGLQEGIFNEPQTATKVILNETDKMTGLVNDILSISRLESGAYKLNKEWIDMPEFLSECLSSMEGAIRDKNLRVGFDVAPQPVEADRIQFEKATRNILTNAIRYARSEIRITYDGKRLEIWDDGPHISEESLKHLFERFYTGPNGNTGIGMSLTKEIVEQHGWKIRAENTQAGVRFVIIF